MAKVFTATAERSGGWWAVTVPEVPGVHTQVRRLDQAADMARDAVALMLDVAEDEVDVQVLPVLGGKCDALLRELAEARDEVRRAETRSQAASRLTATALTGSLGLTLRDAAVIMGLSFQRVAQLVGTDLRYTDEEVG